MKKRPNFLLIMTDQHRADHLGCYGNPMVRTPSIDGLAERGRRFDRFYVANPICMPNRASIMTGRLASLHGALHNGIPLSREHTTFVELLRDAGYRTGLIGKSHLQSFTGVPALRTYEEKAGLTAPSLPLRDAIKNNRHGPDYDLETVTHWERPLAERVTDSFYGFDHVEVAADHADQACGDYLLWARDQHRDFDALVGPRNALPGSHVDAPQAWRTAVPEELYSTSWIEQRTRAFLSERAGDKQPFFVQMSFPDPHHPFTPPGRYWDMYDPEQVALPPSFGRSTLPPVKAMHDALSGGGGERDKQTPFAVTASEARALIALTYGSITMIDDAVGRVLGQLDTLGLAQDTVVIFTSDHGDYMGDHGIMLKMLLHFQGLIRVPFIWSDPAQPQAGTTSTELGSSIDISTTVLARAGIQPYNGIQGRDLMSSAAPDAVLVEEDSQRSMIGFERMQRVRTLVTRSHRLSLRHGENWGELYDLDADPHELHNLFDRPEAAAIQREMSMLMLRKIIEFQDYSPLPAYRA